MKKQQPLALYGGGKLTASTTALVQSVAGQLGPVKACSLRVASRITNNLRAGHPVEDYAEFDRCRLVLIAVPDAQARHAIAHLAASPIVWSGKTVVICSDALGCGELLPISKLGADVASVASVPGFGGSWLIIEVRKSIGPLLRSIFGHRGTRVTVIEPDQKSRYLGALAYAGAEFAPFVRAAAVSLKSAGISSRDAAVLIERQVVRTVRSFYRSGKG